MSKRSLAVSLIGLLAACSSGGETDTQPEASVVVTTVAPSGTEAEAVDESSTTTVLVQDPIMVDYGVTEGSIRVGLSVDLTGPLADVTAAVVDAHSVYFRAVNESGGIGGRSVEIVVLDHASDATTHQDNITEFAERSDNGVVLVGSSGNGELTAAVEAALADADLLAIPRGWTPNLWDAAAGSALFPFGSSTCIDAVNAVEFMAERVGASEAEPATFAAVGRSGLYGEAGIAGARWAAEELGFDVVFAESSVLGEQTVERAEEVAALAPDVVWIAGSPSETATFVAAAQLEDTLWGGHATGYSPAIIESAAASLFDGFVHVGPLAPAAHPEAGRRMIQELLPAATWSQASGIAVGLSQSMIVEAVLREAANREDLTRSGIVAAATAIEVDVPWLADVVSGTSPRLSAEASWISIMDADVATPALPFIEEGASGWTDVESRSGSLVTSGRAAEVCR